MSEYKLYTGDCLEIMKDLPDSSINCCYICRKMIDGATFLRLYNYKFESANMGSIKLLKKSEYKLLIR